MSDRTAQAIALRDHVMRLMEGNSKVVTLGQAKVHTWKRGRFLATLNTPFNPLHERGHSARLRARHRQTTCAEANAL
jgi:hypothetical protein